MKRIFPLLSLFYFLSSCNFNNIANQSKGNVDNCPQSPEESPKIKITKSEDVFMVFVRLNGKKSNIITVGIVGNLP